MATPKVFVSSTCYDLQEERAQLERFISNYGFQPVLSEYSGVYYDVDEHTHVSCVNEVSNCDLFVLIISGRFGGRLKDGDGESITQAEYNQAKRLNIPVFAFVKSDVLAAQLYYKKNATAHDDEFARKINYPSIEKQEDAVDIFNFIQQVQRAQTNNALEPYNAFTDIENHLKRQWAGMFYSYLKKREEQDNVEDILSAVQKLVGSTATLESLVESLHDRNVGADQTKEIIKSSEIRNATFKFYSLLANLLGEKRTIRENGKVSRARLLVTEDTLIQLSNYPVKERLTDYLDINNPIFVVEDVFGFGEDKNAKDYMPFDYISCKQNQKLNAFINRDDVFTLENLYHHGTKNSDKQLRQEAIFKAFEKYIYKE